MKRHRAIQDTKEKSTMSKRARSRGKTRQIWQNQLGLTVVVAAMVLFSGLLVARAAQAAAGTPPLPPAKAQLESQEQEQIAAARAHAQAKVAPQLPAASSAPSRQAGIVAMQQGPFSPLEFTVRNFWQGPVGANWLLVYAGATRNADGSLAAGALRIYTETATSSGDYALHQVGVYAAPRGGALTIVAATGNILTLHAASGATLSFDLTTNSYQ
jgi:hypothetical protein